MATRTFIVSNGHGHRELSDVPQVRTRHGEDKDIFVNILTDTGL